MEKLDLKQQYKELFSPPKDDFVEVAIPTLAFVKVDGTGDPNRAAAYRSAVEWLFGVSYAMKFAAKAQLHRDYVVPPLETLWHGDDPGKVSDKKADWSWTAMVMAPEFVDARLFDGAVAKAGDKLGAPPATLRFEPYVEGRSLQILHVGSYAEEAPILRRLHGEVMPERKLVANGPHHEIYLSDPRKTTSAKLKTILRQPIRDA